jgi:5-deoxy-glucuronate isomerase
VAEQIHAAAAPNNLSVDELHLRSDANGEVAVDPARAGWRYLSFRTASLDPSTAVDVGGPDVETAIVLMAGADAVLERAGEPPWRMAGRFDPFEGLPSGWYLPPGTTGRVAGHASGSRLKQTLVAIATAPASGREGVAAGVIGITPADIKTEIRGAGNATRQINHIIAPDFPADRLEVVEVLTPSGNWSSWPPHKHDVDDMPSEAVLEEIYYYRFRGEDTWGIQRLYRSDRSRDGIWEVRNGNVVLVTDGYHPFIAPQNGHAYYLNALAGDRRTMACSYEPDLAWIRDSWPSETRDPRVPLVTAAGSTQPPLG